VEDMQAEVMLVEVRSLEVLEEESVAVGDKIEGAIT